jgi:hypothetical protein
MIVAKQTRSLSQIARTASTTRVLNLHEVAVNAGATEAYHSEPLFKCHRLNKAIILKHALRNEDRTYMRIRRATATKVIFPLSRSDLRLGGYSFFVEQDNFSSVFQDAVGAHVNADLVAGDIALLKEIARLPTLDPYLIQDATRQFDRIVADCYFNISAADLDSIQEYLLQDMESLVALAYGGSGANTNLIADRLSNLMLRDPGNPSLEALRKALKFSPSDFVIAMRGWKGLLYYKWSYERLRDFFPKIVEQMLTSQFAKATTEDKQYLQTLIGKIITRQDENFSKVKSAMLAYEEAFRALVECHNAKPFHIFINNVSKTFDDIGNAMSEVAHTCEFWQFRRGDAWNPRIDVDDAYEIIGELAHALGIQYDATSA